MAEKFMAFKKHKVVMGIVLLAVILVLVFGTLWMTGAFLKENTPEIKNTFTGARVEAQVLEEFNGTVKKNVTAKNSGTAPGYICIQLEGHRVNDQGAVIGGPAEIPSFTPGTGWLDMGNDLYLYSLPVQPNKTPQNMLIGATGITLKNYDTGADADDIGGKQVVTVIAQIIQSDPSDAIKAEFADINVAANGTLSLK